MKNVLAYDYLCGIKITMFPTTIYKDDEIVLLSGSNKNFKVGDELELNSLCDKYKKSCIIWDYSKKSEGIFGVIIENSIVKCYKEISKDDFNIVQAIYLPTGSELNINYYEEIYDFIEADKKFNKIIESYKEEYLKALIEMQEKSEEDDMYFIMNKGKLEEIDEKMLQINKLFNDEWFINQVPDEILRFGAYLSCLVKETNNGQNEIKALEILGKKKNVSKKYTETINKIEKKLGKIKDEFSNFLSFNTRLNLDYLNWLNLEEAIQDEELRATIEKIIKDIHYHLES